jgi:hypothetical protein
MNMKILCTEMINYNERIYKLRWVYTLPNVFNKQLQSAFFIKSENVYA